MLRRRRYTAKSGTSDQYVYKVGNTTRVACKYGASKDLILEFAPCGLNNITTISNIYIQDNPKTFPDYRLGKVMTPWQTTGTDWVGPYVVMAVNNGNGNTAGFTGGFHGYDGGQTGAKTAYSDSVTVKADGASVPDGIALPCKAVVITVVNRIQAYNTKQADGNGRAVLRETVTYTISEGSVNVSNSIDVLEDVRIETYYGLQTINSKVTGSIHYLHSQHATRQAVLASNSAGAKSSYPNVERYCLRSSDGNHNLIAWLDRSTGLGDGAKVSPYQSIAFTESYGKSYFRLIGDVWPTYAAGTVLTWKGGYVFTPGMTPTGADLVYISKVNGKYRLTLDFLSSGGNPVGLPTKLRNQSVTVIQKDATVSIDSASGPTSIGVSSTGYGTVTVEFPNVT